jgi:hypothetical protein
MQQSEADYHIACMRAVGETLEWLKENRPLIAERIRQRTDEANNSQALAGVAQPQNLR